MCLDTVAECHGKTERRGAGCQIRMEKHVGTTHGKTAEVRECRATMVETEIGLLICQQIPNTFNQKKHWTLTLQPVRLLFFFFAAAVIS